MKVYEVFLKKAGKTPFEHAGSLEAPDAELAVVLARETYARSAEGDEMWLMPRDSIVAVPEELIAPNDDKPHRHNDGAELAARRKQLREAAQNESAS